MLRPERMSRVSVTGSRDVMPAVIEALHDLHLVHLEEYGGGWDGFEPGDPLEGAEEASERLVTVRSIESILDVEADGATPARVVADEYEAELADIRERVNELDDRRSELRDELRAVREARSAAEPLVDLGLDLDLLSGYDSLEVRVGRGDAGAVKAALEAAEGVDAVETWSGEEVVAAFAAGPAGAVDEALVGVPFAAVEVPDAEGPPDAYLEELDHEAERLEGRLETVQAELEELKLEAGRFLLAVEERLSIEVQKAEAPLSFATTRHAFVAEGWLPTDRLDALESTLASAAGDHLEVEELERAEYDAEGVPHGTEAVEDGGEAATDGGRAAADDGLAADGGTDVPMGAGGPPVVMDNPDPVRPFELLVETINKPRYSELDPTLLVWLTFPTFFGFMIGDVGYGVVYTLVGYLMWKRFDSPGLQSLGGVAMWAGFFTMVFGVLYGEFFGLHVLGELVWGGHPPIEKGLDALDFALLWLVVAMVVGLLHVGTGYVLGFVNDLRHGVVDAVLDNGSWLLLMFGAWIWILSRHAAASKPDFVYTLLDSGEEAVFALGFAGFSEGVGLAALAAAAIGLVLMVAGEYRHMGAVGGVVGLLESLNVLVNILSYARITAVLLAKAGMAFVVNLLFFGVYEHDGAHFMHSTTPEHVVAEYGAEAIVFPGLVHGGAAAIVGGLLILVIGHATVWALGITSAGLQAIRLEYVEFFQKFYVGGGDPYEPFGYGDVEVE